VTNLLSPAARIRCWSYAASPSGRCSLRQPARLHADTEVEVSILMLTSAVAALGKHGTIPAEPGSADLAVDGLLPGITAG
jgi:hypothetical protein